MTSLATRPISRATMQTDVRPQVTCSHCGLPVPKGLVEPDRDEQFCCSGCEIAFQLIKSNNLDHFYAIRDRETTDRNPVGKINETYRVFDDPTYADQFYHDLPNGLRSVELYLEGIHCSACMWLIEKLPQITPGVVDTRLDFVRAMVRVVWNPEQTELSRVAHTLASLGYQPHPVRDAARRTMRQREDRKQLIRMGVAGAAAGNTMLLAFALYAGLFTGIESQFETLFRWASMLFGVIALAWPGSVFFRGAWAALSTRTPHMDLPIALGLSVGGVVGIVNTVTGHGEVYFDSLTVLVFLLLVGRWIQHRRQRSANDAVELLYSLIPLSARRVDDDQVTEVPIDALEIDDLVEVRAGDSVPADGVVESGDSKIDESLLTGESVPKSVSSGDNVYAGTTNQAAMLRLRVQAKGGQTRVGRLMDAVERASESKPVIVQTADLLSGWFVLIVTAIALTTFGVCIVMYPNATHIAADRAVALLIVACPCALGLATPLAIAVAMGRAAKRSILIKGGHILESLSKPGTMWLDKTGTITDNQPSLVDWYGDEEIKPIVAAIEAHASHPIAKALTAALPNKDEAATDVIQHPDGGIEGTVHDKQVIIGSTHFMTTRAVTRASTMDHAIQSCIDRNLTPVQVSVDGRVVAVAGIGHSIRPDAQSSINALRERGWRLGILSGDHPHLVERVADELGIDPDMTFGGITPEGKQAILKKYQSGKSTTVMVGDGINDSAALAQATVGIAVHGGAEVSLAAADVYIGNPGLTPIVELVHASDRSMKTIRRNIVASLGYNVAAVTLAAFGLINPLVAAILMPISSFTVLSISIGSRTFGSDTSCP